MASENKQVYVQTKLYTILTTAHFLSKNRNGPPGNSLIGFEELTKHGDCA